ncbi:MAG TPA: trypsin-like peptidase domain-containing protein [Thermoanaerobaculia bacterium]|nr:trypsin-like peptidase domain-containing protein [Thermoanaerobaculia bacterium]
MSSLNRMVLAAVIAGFGFLAGLSWPRDGRVGVNAPSALAQTTPQGQVRPAAQGQGRPAAVPRPELAQEERATIALFERASPSVVYITSLARQRDFFSMNVQEIPQGSGSGFLWDRQGHVVTNFHVVQGASSWQVTLSDQSTWDAELVGGAAEKDLAVLRIRPPQDRLRPLPLGNSDDLRVGQAVFAIGNPFGLDQTLTTGVVSALGREIQSVNGVPIRDVVQTDAAINPGNSGGPLLDSAGRLIGVNTAIYSPSGAYAGIGFAIPEHSVRWVVPDLIRYGRVNRPTLGVELAPEAWNQQIGVEGAVIVRVEPGSGAARAGLRGIQQVRGRRMELGDVIQSVDGQPVTSTGDLILALEQKRAGDTVRVGILRAGRRQEVRVRLDPAGGR